MKKSVIALAIANSVIAQTVYADNATSTNQMTDNQATEKTIESIVITANRTPQEKFDVLAAVDVFYREDIDRIQPTSIADLLTRVAGVTSSAQGSAGHNTSLFVRGTNSDHILVLVNGIRVGSATLGTKEFGTIPVALIERVEIVKGPRASLWGSDAVGGVIQIFTRQLAAGEKQIGATVGSNNFWQIYGVVGLGNDKHNYTLSATAEDTDGYDVIKPNPSSLYTADQPDDDGYDRQSIALVGLSKISDTFSLETNSQFDQGTTEIDSSYGGDEYEHDNHHLLARGHWQLENILAQLSYANSKDYNEDNGDKVSDFGTKAFFETKRDQVDGLLQFTANTEQNMSLGGQWYKEKVDSSNAYSETERDVYALFASAQQQFDLLKLEASLRYDHVGDVDSETSYHLSSGYQINPHWLISLSHGTAFKAPSFNELFWPDEWGSAGNPNLVSETSKNTEILTRYQYENVQFELSLYQSDIDNLIEWAPIDSSDPFSGWQPSNIANAKIKGVDASVHVTFEKFKHQLALSHVDAENEDTDQQLFLRPYFSAFYAISYQVNDWNLAFDVNYQGDRTDSSGVKLASYTLFNATINYQLTPDLALHGKVTNLGDKDYQQVYEYPGEERGFRVGVDYRF